MIKYTNIIEFRQLPNFRWLPLILASFVFASTLFFNPPVLASNNLEPKPNNFIGSILALCIDNVKLGGTCISNKTLNIIINNASYAVLYEDTRIIIFYNKNGAKIFTARGIGRMNFESIILEPKRIIPLTRIPRKKLLTAQKPQLRRL